MGYELELRERILNDQPIDDLIEAERERILERVSSGLGVSREDMIGFSTENRANQD